MKTRTAAALAQAARPHAEPIYLAALELPDGPTLRLSDRYVGPVRRRIYAREVMADAPVAWWRLGEPSGTTLLDASGQGRTGTYAASGVTYSRPGLLSQDPDTGVLFDGVAGGATVGDHPSLDIGLGSMTWECWIRTTQVTAGSIYRKSDASNARGILVDLNNVGAGSLRARVSSTGAAVTVTVSAAGPYTDGARHHVVVVLDRARHELSLFVDGALLDRVDASALADDNLDAAASVEISPASSRYAGDLDELALYATALSPSRVVAHYAAGISTAAARVGEEWLPLVAQWGTIEEVVDPITGDGAPATFDLALVNDVPIAGRARLSDLIRSPLNPTGYEFAFAKLSVYRLDAALGPGTEELLGVFYIEDPTEIGERLLRLRASDVTLILDDESPVTVIARETFPQAAADAIGAPIPRAIGRLNDAPLRFLDAGQVGELVADIDAVATEIAVEGSRLFTGLSFMLDAELIVAAARNGDLFTGCQRGAHGTDAVDHAAGGQVFEIRPSYFAALAEHDGRFVPRLSDVRVDGGPANAALTAIELDIGLEPATGRRFTGVRFTPVDVRLFHTLPGNDQGQTVATLVSGQVAEGTSSAVTRVVSVIGAGDVAAGATVRSARCTVRHQAGSGPVTWYFERRQAGGAWRVLSSGINVSSVAVDTTIEDDVTYPGTGNDEFRLRVYGHNGTSTVALQVLFNTYNTSFGTGAAGASTAAKVIGRVTADVVGVCDDAAGTITGTAWQVLDNPADALAYLLTRCYPSSGSVTLHAGWGTTRAALAQLGLRWATLIGADGAPSFSDLRRQAAAQSRCWLTTEAGAMRLVLIPDAPAPALTLDYTRDVWEQQPAVALRTSRTQLYTRVDYRALRDPETGEYAYSESVSDLTQPGLTRVLTTTLDFPWIQDPALADQLAAFWLRWWKRPRFQVDAVGWQGLLAVEKGDALAVDQHPVLTAHGGPALPFLVYRKAYRLGDDNPSRIQLAAIEAAA